MKSICSFLGALLLLLTANAQKSQSQPLFDMNKILDESTLGLEVIQDWHLVPGKVPTRQKYMTINVGEFWPGQNYRVPVRLIVPAKSKAKGFHLTGGHQLQRIQKDYKLRGIDEELIKGNVGLVHTIVQTLNSWGQKELWDALHKRFYKSLNPHDSIQYWGWPGSLMRAITAAYAEKAHFEPGKIVASGGSKNGASPSVSLIHDKRITGLVASVSPISESPLRLCDEEAWKKLKEYESTKGSKRKHPFLGGTFGPIYNQHALEQGHTWEDLKKLAERVEDYVFVSKNLEQFKTRGVQMLFHPGTHDFVCFDMHHVGKNYPQIPMYLGVNTGHGKKGSKSVKERQENLPAFLMQHFFDGVGEFLNPPKVSSKKVGNKLQVTVKFDSKSKAESGQIFWMYDRAPDGSLDYINQMFPEDQHKKMKYDEKTNSWSVEIDLKSGAKKIDFFSNHKKTLKHNSRPYSTIISSPYTRVAL